MFIVKDSILDGRIGGFMSVQYGLPDPTWQNENMHFARYQISIFSNQAKANMEHRGCVKGALAWDFSLCFLHQQNISM